MWVLSNHFLFYFSVQLYIYDRPPSRTTVSLSDFCGVSMVCVLRKSVTPHNFPGPRPSSPTLQFYLVVAVEIPFSGRE